MVFWIGPGMESFLAPSLEGLGPDTWIVGLMEAPLARISKLAESMTSGLRKVRQTPYVLFFHDTYRYFEDYFQLSALSAVTINPERPPSQTGGDTSRPDHPARSEMCVCRAAAQPILGKSAVLTATASRWVFSTR